jgi:hypothetical protein
LHIVRGILRCIIHDAVYLLRFDSVYTASQNATQTLALVALSINYPSYALEG